ncbi:hypothetical protein C7S16_3285 [Burkholderia thailandensis]|uniref:Uncharacterized protein n=1 Tax=Burkholderia thailandensis TaxID=57975 RepID=A0AAW9D1S0_BURTH|nr:hypothetical protein [Burkholderia thailandensis]
MPHAGAQAKTNKNAGSISIRRNRRVRATFAARRAFRLSIRFPLMGD